MSKYTEFVKKHMKTVKGDPKERMRKIALMWRGTVDCKCIPVPRPMRK